MSIHSVTNINANPYSSLAITKLKIKPDEKNLGEATPAVPTKVRTEPPAAEQTKIDTAPLRHMLKDLQEVRGILNSDSSGPVNVRPSLVSFFNSLKEFAQTLRENPDQAAGLKGITKRLASAAHDIMHELSVKYGSNTPEVPAPTDNGHIATAAEAGAPVQQQLAQPETNTQSLENGLRRSRIDIAV